METQKLSLAVLTQILNRPIMQSQVFIIGLDCSTFRVPKTSKIRNGSLRVKNNSIAMGDWEKIWVFSGDIKLSLSMIGGILV